MPSTVNGNTQETKVLGSPVKDRDVSPARGLASPSAKTGHSPGRKKERAQEPAKPEPVKAADDYEDDFEDGNNTQEFISSFEEESKCVGFWGFVGCVGFF
jgi:hypothetical protein